MKIGVILMSLIFGSVAALDYDKFAMPKYGSVLTKSIAKIIFDFFAKESNTLTITRSAFREDRKILQDDIINEVLYMTKNKIVVQLTSPDELHLTDGERKFFNLWIVDGLDGFRQIYDQMSPDYYDYTGYYLIVITDFSIPRQSTMRAVFEDMWKLYITNVNILITSPENDDYEAQLYTYFPYTPYHCEKVFPVIRDYFHGEKFERGLDFYPEKVKNLHGCPLTVAAFDYPPFMMLTPQEIVNYYPDGFEGVLLRVLYQRLNFTAKIQIPKLNRRWGLLTEEGQATGAMRMVLENEVNFTLGFFGQSYVKNKFMGHTISYYVSDQVLIVPPGNPYTALEKLFFPFRDSIWIAIFAYFGVAFLLILVLKYTNVVVQKFVYGKRALTPCLNMMNICFGGAMPVLPSRNFARFLLGSWMMYSLIIRSAYQGALYEYLQLPANKSIVKSFEELAGRHYNVYMVQNFTYIFDSLPDIRKRVIVSTPGHEAELLDNIQHSEVKGGILSTLETVSYMNKNLTKTGGFYRMMNERAYVQQLSIYSQKFSCLLRPFDYLINQLGSSGLIKQWASQSVDKRYLKEQSPHQEPKKLSNAHLKGMYEIFLLGLGLSFFVFILELLSLRNKRIKRIMDVIEIYTNK